MFNFPVPTVSLVDSRPATTSLAIAEHFGKNHKEVLRDIRALIENCPRDFTERNFEPSEYTDPTGRKLPMYHVFFDGFILLVMGYTGPKALQMKLAYIEAFNAMRDQLAGRTLSSPEAPITPDQQNALLSVARSKVRLHSPKANKGLRMSLFQHIWTRFNNHFRLAKYNQLPQCKMSEALEFLVKLEIQPAKIDRKPREVDIVEGTPDFDLRKLPSGFGELLKLADEAQAALAAMERLIFQATRCQHSINLDDERMLFVQNAVDLVDIARINLKSCEYALRSFARIRSRVSFIMETE